MRKPKHPVSYDFPLGRQWHRRWRGALVRVGLEQFPALVALAAHGYLRPRRGPFAPSNLPPCGLSKPSSRRAPLNLVRQCTAGGPPSWRVSSAVVCSIILRQLREFQFIFSVQAVCIGGFRVFRWCVSARDRGDRDNVSPIEPTILEAIRGLGLTAASLSILFVVVRWLFARRRNTHDDNDK